MKTHLGRTISLVDLVEELLYLAHKAISLSIFGCHHKLQLVLWESVRRERSKCRDRVCLWMGVATPISW